jgi:hypothetical protein
VCLVNPAMIQRMALQNRSNRWTSRINPFWGWMQRPSYRVYLRFMGIFMFLFAGLLAFALVA